jgi:hypothetical protein
MFGSESSQFRGHDSIHPDVRFERYAESRRRYHRPERTRVTTSQIWLPPARRPGARPPSPTTMNRGRLIRSGGQEFRSSRGRRRPRGFMTGGREYRGRQIPPRTQHSADAVGLLSAPAPHRPGGRSRPNRHLSTGGTRWASACSCGLQQPTEGHLPLMVAGARAIRAVAGRQRRQAVPNPQIKGP